MPYNITLAEGTRNVLNEKQITFTEKKMMGGLTFMINDKMCVGVVENKLMVRIGPDVYEEALTKNGCKEMKFTGRPMKGFVFIEPSGVAAISDLKYWVKLALDYNPKAKSSKKKS